MVTDMTLVEWGDLADERAIAWIDRYGLTVPARADVQQIADEMNALFRLFTTDSAGDAYTRFMDRVPWTTARLRSLFGATQVQVPNDSDINGPPFFQMRLADGTTGYFQRRFDDCLQAAVATLLQVSPYEVPDLQLIQRALDGASANDLTDSTTMDGWLADRGLRMSVSEIGNHDEARWIGVVGASAGIFQSHCLLMHGSSLLFNPFWPLPPADEQTCALSDIDVALTIEEI